MRLIIFCSLFCLSVLCQAQYDVLIINGKLIDGSGNNWIYADVAVKDGKIAAIGKLSNHAAAKVIDAKGLYIAPGFIDVHTHIEGSEVRVPTADNFIFDGVTTVVTGNCGSSRVDVKRYFEQIDSVKTSINISTLIGHNSVRREVMGVSQREPSAEEQKQMEELVAQAMREGAVGFSTGLIYVPGTYSKTPEVVGLAKAAAQFNGVYASHIRSEGDNVVDAINEAINIGREAGMPVQISHFKVTYKPNWGRSVQPIAMIDKAREEGIDVTIDQYPYVASSTTLNTVLPTWVFSGGNDSVMYRLNNPEIRKQIKKEMLDILKKKQLKHYDYAFVARYRADSTYNGKNIYEINKMLGKKAKASEEAETILDMVSNGSAQMVFFSMHEDDLQRIMKYPFNMFASDAGIPVYGSGMPHPRAYGTNARVLGRYVNELNVMRLEEAIRRMSSLPAQKFNLRDRGLIREGYAADIVIFDEKEVGDRATFQQPHAYSTGFKYVIVNGELVVENERHTGVRSGTVLLGPGYRK
ncbi:MAG TPA: D-aminoacylase [Cyclobacteriaceae bacterium]|nr:D-aminoacylase [Cyclobacteriaceae bacterium]